MKKILFIILATALLSGCGGTDNVTPIVVTLPASSPTNPIRPGSSVTLTGKGFDASSEIWLRSQSDGTDTPTTVTDITSSSLTFTAPAVGGRQTVILKQDGNAYELGTLHFAETAELLPQKLIEAELTTDSGENYTFTYSYDEQDRLKSLRIKFLYDDDPDYEDEGTTTYIYGDNTIIMNSYFEEFQIFELSEGRAVKLESDYFECYFEYDDNGYKNGWKYASSDYTQDEASGRWTVVDGNPVEYYETYPEDTMTFRFTLDPERPNNTNYDFYALLLWDWSPANFYLDNLNIGGNRFRNLPSEIVIDDRYTRTINYETDGEYISGITILDSDESGNTTSTDIRLSYEK